MIQIYADMIKNTHSRKLGQPTATWLMRKEVSTVSTEMLINLLNGTLPVDPEAIKIEDQSDGVSLLRPSLTAIPTSRNTERYSLACLWDEIKYVRVRVSKQISTLYPYVLLIQVILQVYHTSGGW